MKHYFTKMNLKVCWITLLLFIFCQGVFAGWNKHIIDTGLEAAPMVYVADMDGDEDMDMVVTWFNAHDVVWYEAPDNPTGTWIKHNITTNLEGPVSVYVFDFDGDNNPDVAVAADVADDVVWYVPEFSTIGIPIVTMIALFVVFRRKKQKV